MISLKCHKKHGKGAATSKIDIYMGKRNTSYRVSMKVAKTNAGVDSEMVKKW
jgi:hypothetical protein